MLLTADWLKPRAAAITVVRPVGVFEKELLLQQLAVNLEKWRAGVYEQ